MKNKEVLTNLSLEGGGIRCLAHIGALVAFYELKVLDNFKNYSTSSGGAIIGGLVYVGMSPKHLLALLDVDFSKFKDNSFGLSFDLIRLFRYYGWNKGDYFLNWYKKLLFELTSIKNPTFKDLHEFNNLEVHDRGLVVTTSCVVHQRVEYYSYHTTPHYSVAKAIRASMAMPGIFTPVMAGECILVDGGMLENYPIKVFDGYSKNKSSIGLLLTSEEEREFKPIKIDNLKDFGLSCLQTIIGNSERLTKTSVDWSRTISIDTLGVGATDFDIDKTTKEKLVQSGYYTTMEFMKKIA